MRRLFFTKLVSTGTSISYLSERVGRHITRHYGVTPAAFAPFHQSELQQQNKSVPLSQPPPLLKRNPKSASSKRRATLLAEKEDLTSLPHTVALHRSRTEKDLHASAATTAVVTATLDTTRASLPSYRATLRKSHTSRRLAPPASSPTSQTAAAATLESDNKDKARYDPALVVHTDSHTQQVHLNPIQKELVWSARRQEYQRLLVRVVTCLHSHQTPLEKYYTLLALHDEVVLKRLRLRADTYEDVFHLLYAVGVQGRAELQLRRSGDVVEGDAALEDELRGTATAGNTALSAPLELRTPLAASQAVLGPHAVEKMWSMYRYMVDSGTDPTARVVQYVMGLLERSAAVYGGDRGHRLRTEAKAHALMLDVDRHHLTPSEFTINSYIGVCDASSSDAMHLAAARVADYLSRHERQGAPGLYTRLLCGMLRHGHEAEALATVTTLQHTPLTNHLLNAVLQTARRSPDPSAAFAMYRAALPTDSGSSKNHHRVAQTDRPLRPSLHTMSILLEVMRETNNYTELDFVLHEMKRYKLRGNGVLLNKLVGALVLCERRREAKLLCAQMERKHIVVFDELKRELGI